ncbi:MAG TPA: serine hydrolase domain-containing protein [Tepidisphaeraceae bacterium]|jgi:CubicO group peptidase (beta-lactamase class C family)
MSRWLVAGLVLLLVALSRADSLPAGNAAAERVSLQKVDAFSRILRDQVDAKQIGGASALVARHGKVVYFTAAGLADPDTARPVDRGTIFRIASMTKPITSVAAMILVEDGKLSVDDPVARFLPEFKTSSVFVRGAEQPLRDASRPIRIRDLLTQTSGITYRFMNKPSVGDLYVRENVQDGLAESPFSLAENCKRIAAMPLLNDPGAAWEYGLNTDVLGRVIEVASGQSLDEFMRKRILDPLKMNDTFFIVPRDQRDRLSAVYMPDAKNRNEVTKVGTDRVVQGALVWSTTYSTQDDSTYYSGGGGLCSTIGDYSRFLQMLLNGGELDGARVLKADTVARMLKDQIAPLHVTFAMHGDGFGYGVGVMTDHADRKDGDVAPAGSVSWGGFFYTYFWADPKNNLVAVMMTQTWPNGHLKLREQFKKAVYDAIEN